ncbi:MAG: ABC transporter permease [Chloroflexota bacterium]
MAASLRPRFFPAAPPTIPDRPAHTLWTLAFDRLRRDRLTLIALAILALFALLAIFAAPIAAAVHSTPDQVDPLNSFDPPSAQHWMGTDDVGRDQFVRMLYGARISLSIGLVAALINLFLGILIGAIAAFYGRIIDDIVVWLINTLRSIPTLFLLIIVSVLFHVGPIGLAVLIGLTSWTGAARLVRGQVFQLKERDYVLSARAVGAGNVRIISRHILPNVLSLVVVLLGIDIGGAILAESGLSYLGLGVQPPTPSWGNMLSGAQSYFEHGPWLVYGPGIAIALTVWCLYTVGDGIRDAIDPRSHKAH